PPPPGVAQPPPVVAPPPPGVAQPPPVVAPPPPVVAQPPPGVAPPPPVVAQLPPVVVAPPLPAAAAPAPPETPPPALTPPAAVVAPPAPAIVAPPVTPPAPPVAPPAPVVAPPARPVPPAAQPRPPTATAPAVPARPVEAAPAVAALPAVTAPARVEPAPALPLEPEPSPERPPAAHLATPRNLTPPPARPVALPKPAFEGDDVDALLAVFEISSRKDDRGVSADLRGLVDVALTPPPPTAEELAAFQRPRGAVALDPPLGAEVEPTLRPGDVAPVARAAAPAPEHTPPPGELETPPPPRGTPHDESRTPAPVDVGLRTPAPVDIHSLTPAPPSGDGPFRRTRTRRPMSSGRHEPRRLASVALPEPSAPPPSAREGDRDLDRDRDLEPRDARPRATSRDRDYRPRDDRDDGRDLDRDGRDLDRDGRDLDRYRARDRDVREERGYDDDVPRSRRDRPREPRAREDRDDRDEAPRSERLRAPRLPAEPSYSPPRAPRTSFALVAGALLAVLGVSAAIYARHPEFFGGSRGGPTAAPSSAPTPQPGVPSGARCKASVVVTDVPAGAEVLWRVGRAPTDAERLPVGRLEFVATAEGFAPKRAVVPAGVAWDTGPDGKPRFELAVQLDPTKKPGADEPWPPGETGAPVGGTGAPGTVHLVTTPRGAEVWLLMGLGPEARIDQLACSADVDVLVAGPGTSRRRLRAPADALSAAPVDGAQTHALRLSAK
ncbi:MAG TPA: hypothetical protein PK141_23960, partial [Polyangiaceae bacterium]|nr:hypothetical protein [Polyangiaceae bacterium]